MSYGQRHNSGPPAWFIFVVVIALVFGSYYLWVGFQDYVSSGGLSIRQATQQAATVSSATAERVSELQTSAPTPRPSSTAVPACQEFIVSVPSAIVRAGPATNTDILDSLPRDEPVCVISRVGPESEWFLIDLNRLTRRLEPAYMHEDIIEAVYPTPTPSDTFTPLPSVTFTPTFTPSDTPLPSNTPTDGPSPTDDPAVTDTPTPTPTPTSTDDEVVI